MSVPTIDHMRLYHLQPVYEAAALNLEMPTSEPVGSPLTDGVLGADEFILNDIPNGWVKRLLPYVKPGDCEASRAATGSFCKTDSVDDHSIYLNCAS